MRTFKIVVFAALTIFHLTTIIVISIGRNNFDFLLNLFNKLDLMLYGSYLGLFLFATVMVFDWLGQKKVNTLNKKHQEEINELKAKLYDKKENEHITAETEQKAESSTDDSSSNKEEEDKV
jgi:ABC-type transport system involved in cytochrome bd biosynthesis fused ATPase/permease subunit